MDGWVGGWVDGWMRAHARPSLCCGRVYLPRAPGSPLVALWKLRIDSTTARRLQKMRSDGNERPSGRKVLTQGCKGAAYCGPA